MRALATGALPISEKIAAHLSLCLACRACERVCPSAVQYGELIEAGRTFTHNPQSRSWRARLGLGIVARPRLLEKLGTALRWYQRSGLQSLVRASAVLRRLGLQHMESLLPTVSSKLDLRTFYPAQGKKRGRVALFLGCVARVLDSPTLAAAIRLLTRFGFEVIVPATQTCCGAMHRDAGDLRTSRKLEECNRAAFHPAKNDIGQVDAIITVASGCSAALVKTNRPAGAIQDLHPPVQDINQFLAGQSLPETLVLAPLVGSVAVHEPCSLRNALHAEHSVYSFLQRIPNLQLTGLPENHLCCGGAGAYPLRQPAMAEYLRAQKLVRLQEIQPSILVTANIGCALHLAAGLRERGLNIEIVHPVVLFDRQVRDRIG